MKSKPKSRPKAHSLRGRPLKRGEQKPRTRRLVCLLTEDEERAITRHLNKYKISNRSAWVRETLLRSIFQRRMEDYPMLFQEHEMRQ